MDALQHLSDSFAVCDEARAIAGRLIADCEEFSHLRDAVVVHLLSQRELHLHGGRKAAIVATGKCHAGVHRNLFEWMLAMLAAPHCGGADPEFVIYYDTAVWNILAPDAALAREALVYHELCHIAQQTDEFGAPKFDDRGKAKLKLVPHDIERFDREITRYGPAFLGLHSTAQAFVQGNEAAKARQLAAETATSPPSAPRRRHIRSQ